ncbi:MAG TPA: MXAN_5187 C-terminal domain-containing protein [Myxococcota bacterium]|nr:MXAN_5187 C-terminal domain-containing protein [Myxococcota bacterium]
MSDQTQSLDEEIEVLDRKLGQLKREYDQYFLGARPREPILLKGEVYKKVAFLSQQPIQNTALRFRFGTICSRYQSMRRQWEEILRKMEAGTYERHKFKADLHERVREKDGDTLATAAGAPASDDLFDAYVEARRACGQSVKGLTREKLEKVLDKQREGLRDRFGDKAKFRFRVVVESGQVRLKASKA